MCLPPLPKYVNDEQNDFTFFTFYRERETCGSWLGPSYYFEVYNYEGNLVYKVEGPAGYPWECTRDSVAVFKVKQ